MNEEVVSTPQREGRKTVPLIVMLIVVILAGLAAYFLILRAGLASDPAAFVPRDVAVAVTVDLTKSADKDATISYIKDILKEAGVKNPEKELFESIDKELKISVQKDVLRHLDGVGAFAVLTEMAGMMPSMVAVVGTKSDGDAKDVMTNIGNKFNENKVKFSRLSYNKYYYYRIPSGRFTSYLGQVKNSIVYATSDSGIKKVVDTIEGKPSLLDDKNFVVLRKKNSTTFASIYYSGAGYYKLLGPFISMGAAQMGPDAADWFKKNTENTIAAIGNAEASAEGLKFSFKAITQQSSPVFKETSLDNLASTAPKDAAVVCSVEDWSAIWSEIKRQLTENPSIKSQIDQGVDQAKQMLQLDPFNDVLDRITAFGMYYTPKRAGNLSAFPGHMTFVLTVDKPNVIRKSLNKINNAIVMFGGIKLKPVNVAGENVNIGALGGNDGQFADALVGNKAIITISGANIRDGLQSAISTVKGKATTASTTDGFKLVKEQLPGKSATLFYVNLEPIFGAFMDEVSNKDKKTIDAIMKKVGVIGSTSSASGTESEGVLVIPFKR